MIVCVLLPRFELVVATAQRRELLGHPTVLAPAPGAEQLLGEVSGAAEAFGVRKGMRLGEALARCPELTLVPPDPQRAQQAWEQALQRLENTGAAVEPGQPGEALFAADGLRGLADGTLEGVLRRTRAALGVPTRLGAGPTRFCARAAADRRGRAGSRHATTPRRDTVIVAEPDARAFLAPLPIGLLHTRPELRDLPNELERLGAATLGALAALPDSSVADRFGRAGQLALALARGRDTALAPRSPVETLGERLELPEDSSGFQLERVLGLLVDRLLARPERRERTLRRLRMSAVLVEGGTWLREAPLREASADGQRLRLALAPRLVELPSPARALGLEALAFGPPAQAQLSLVRDRAEQRQARIAEAARQARAAAGPDAVLRLVEVDPESRVPERRAVLSPYTRPGDGGRGA
ncbi:MAG: hypothetical protein ACR2NA_13985 [Solirubrobacterales bacterium]